VRVIPPGIPSGSQNLYFPGVTVPSHASPDTTAYSTYDCTGTPNSTHAMAWSTPGSGNYRWLITGRVWQ
jgi:hypothetical protein